MKLEKVRIKNFRCFNSEIEFLLDDLTCIIGKNDIGKSTVLEALDAFFNDKIDNEDLSADNSSSTIEITCFFSGLPDQIVLDSTANTSPFEEGILNLKGELEVIRRFKIGTTITKSIYINGFYPIDNRVSDLLTLKNGPLKAKADELGVNLEGISKSKNPQIRKAIRDFIGGNRALMEIKVEGNLTTENNLKTIWKKLYDLLPIFSLFKVDKTLDDKDKDVQDPMKSAVEESLAIPEIKELLEKVEDKVREKSTEVADRIINKLKDIDISLAEKLKSNFKKTPNWKSIFDLTLLNENNIPLNKRGSGVRRLVLLSFFQAQAEKRKVEKNAPSIIYAIEEPEISQHPDHQLILINSLNELSKQQNIQVIFTSHSSNLVREIPIKSLRYIFNNNGQILIDYGWDYKNDVKNEATIEKIIKALGILPNPADKVEVLLYVEGNNDVNAMKRYSKILNENNPHLLDLNNDDRIGYVVGGGSSIKHYLEHKYLQGLGKPEVHLYDSDKQEYIDFIKKINSEENKNKVGFNTTKLELENYLHKEAIIEAYRDNGLKVSISDITDDDDVPLKVAEAIYSIEGEWSDLDDIQKKAKADDKKKFLNTIAVEKMTVERLKERNGYEDIVSWLNAIQKFITSNINY